MKLKSFEHVLIIAQDLEATKDFYTEIVGLVVGERPNFRFPGYWLYLGDTPCIHLGSYRRRGKRSRMFWSWYLLENFFGTFLGPLKPRVAITAKPA